MAVLEWSSNRIWDELLTPEMRRQAANAFWEYDGLPEQIHRQAETLLLQVVKWRPQRFRSLPSYKKAEHLLTHRQHPSLEAVRWCAVAAYLELRVPDLRREFNGYWGIDYRPWKGPWEEQQKAEAEPPPTFIQISEVLKYYRKQFRRLDIAVFLALSGMQSLAWREAVWPRIGEVLADREMVDPPTPTPSTALALHDSLFPDLTELTPLDRLLAQQALDAAAAEDGAALERVVRAMDELLRLAPARALNWFLQGMVRQLPVSPETPRPSPSGGVALDWYLTGRIGALSYRQADRALLALAEEEKAGIENLLAGDTEGAPFCASTLFIAYWRDGSPEQAIRFLRPELMARQGSGMVHPLAGLAEDRLLVHGPRDARAVLERLQELEAHLPAGSLPPHFYCRLIHLRARCLQGECRFTESRALLEDLGHRWPRAEIQADLGLVAGEYRWLSEVEIPATREQVPEVMARLRRGQDHFQAAIQGTHRPPLPGALYPLGLLALLEGEAETAARYLGAAGKEAEKRESHYRAGKALARIRAAHGLALLSTLSEANLKGALEQLQQADAVFPAAQWPAWLLAEAAQIVDLSDTPEAAALLEWLQQRAPSVAEVHLRDSYQLGRSPSLLQALAARAAQLRDRDPEEVWQDNAALLTACLQGTDLATAGEALDRLEGLALVHAGLRERWLNLLGRPEAYSPAWDEEDALLAAAHLCETTGTLERAYGYLRTLVQRAREQGQTSRITSLRERIRGYRLPADLVEEVLLPDGGSAEPEPPEAIRQRAKLEQDLRTGVPVRLLVVGGDEAERRWTEELLAYFGEKAPGLILDFEFTPRTSSWDRHYERVKGRLDRYDGLVMLPWLRTNMGRLLRAQAGERGVPWFPCPGSGRSQLQRSILEAACSVVRARRQQSEGEPAAAP